MISGSFRCGGCAPAGNVRHGTQAKTVVSFRRNMSFFVDSKVSKKDIWREIEEGLFVNILR